MTFVIGIDSALVSIPILDDVIVEEAENFSLQLFTPSIGMLDPGASMATGIIADDDGKTWSKDAAAFSPPLHVHC